MSRLPMLALLLSACGVEPASLPADQLAPAGVLTLTHTPLVTGERATITVTGAAPNQTMFLFRSTAVQPMGFCPGVAAPDCMDLEPPLINTFSMRSDAAGVAEITFPFPNLPAAVTSVAMQVGYLTNPGADTSNAVLATVFQGDADDDGDHLSNADELGYGTDPGSADSDGGGAPDGEEIALGLDPNDAGDDGMAMPITWDSAIGQLMIDRCSGCHINGSSSGQLNLDDYANVLPRANQPSPRIPNITPGSVEDSYLWHKVQGTQGSVGGSGSRMPRGRAALPDDEKLLLRIWIEQGAFEN